MKCLITGMLSVCTCYAGLAYYACIHVSVLCFQALDGEYWFDMGDHGGIQVALGWHSGSASSML